MKPILFNTEMVRAILDGRKTVTRRVVDIDLDIPCNHGEHEFIWDNFDDGGKATGFVCRKCGFGVTPPHCRRPVGTSFLRPRYFSGDILYVPEAWKCSGTFGELGYEVEFRNGQHIKFQFEDRDRAKKWAKYRDKPSHQWQSPYFMPREAARLFLRVTDVRVERLQEIGDCTQEGIPHGRHATAHMNDYDERCDFAALWDSTIPRDKLPIYGWKVNPWVWAYRFERISKEDALKGGERNG